MKLNTGILKIALVLMLPVILTMATCGSENDPAEETDPINYNYDYTGAAPDPYDAVMHDYYLDWEEEVSD